MTDGDGISAIDPAYMRWLDLAFSIKPKIASAVLGP